MDDDETLYPGEDTQVLQLRMRHGRYVNFNYVIADRATLRAVVVDPAWEMDRLVSALKRHRWTLEAVLLTHSHPDHVDLCHQVADRFDCPILMHEEEVDFAGFRSPRLQRFRDLETYYLGRTWVTPIHTPGHTPGSACFLTSDVVVTGDTLFNEGCGVCHLHGGDPQVMFRTLRRLRTELPGRIRMLPGHSYGTPPGLSMSDVLQMNIYLMINDPERFVEFRMQSAKRKSIQW